MSRVKVRDGRQAPAVCVAKSDLAIIGERVERRRLSAVRSTYLALLEVCGEPDGWTRKALAERAGVGAPLLKEAIETLEQLGLVRGFADGSYQLAAPSGSGSAVLPVADPEPAPAPQPSAANPRAEAFFAWHAARVEPVRGNRPAKTAPALAAAETILGLQSDSAQIKARLDWALGNRFYASKVLTLSDFAQWWGRINAEYLASTQTASQSATARPEARPIQTSYESERVEVTR